MVLSSTCMNRHPHPAIFDGRRFLHERKQPDKEDKSQFVSATVDHIVFGYGAHACPGRLLAVNEAKIIHVTCCYA